MTWDDDFEESPQYEEYMLYKTMSDDKANGAVDYHAPKSKRASAPHGDTGVWYDEDPHELAKSLVPPVTQPQGAVFRYQEHLTSRTQQTRNRLMYGKLYTRTETVQLWGFRHWQECQDHIVDGIQPRLKWDKDELEADGARLSWWLPKNYQARTRRGYAAVVADWGDERVIVHYINGERYYNKGLSKGKQNQVRINYEDQLR